MEELVLVLAVAAGELVAVAALVAMACAVEAVALAVILGMEAFARPGARRPVRSLWRWLVIGRRAALAILGLSLAGLLLSDLLPTGGAIGLVLAAVERRTGLAVTYQQATGRLLSGRFRLAGVRVRRDVPDASALDLSVADVEVDFDMRGLLAGEAALERLVTSGVRGTIDQRRVRRILRPRSSGRFVVEVLDVRDLEVIVRSGHEDGARDLPVSIESLRLAPLRRSWAVFDALFAAEAQGRVAGQAFSIERRDAGGDHGSIWTVEDIPLSLPAQLGLGSLGSLKAGTIDVHVESRWAPGDLGPVAMQWRIGFRDLEVEPGPSAGSPSGKLPGSMMGLVGKLARHLSPIEFSVSIDREAFHEVTSVEATGIWATVGKAFRTELERRRRQAVDEIRDLGRRTVRTLKELLGGRPERGR